MLKSDFISPLYKFVDLGVAEVVIYILILLCQCLK